MKDRSDRNMGRRCKQLLQDDLKEKRGYWKLNEEAPDCTLWGNDFVRGYGPVVREITEQMKTLLVLQIYHGMCLY
jgi:hypothetical protein